MGKRRIINNCAAPMLAPMLAKLVENLKDGTYIELVNVDKTIINHPCGPLGNGKTTTYKNGDFSEGW